MKELPPPLRNAKSEDALSEQEQAVGRALAKYHANSDNSAAKEVKEQQWKSVEAGIARAKLAWIRPLFIASILAGLVLSAFWLWPSAAPPVIIPETTKPAPASQETVVETAKQPEEEAAKIAVEPAKKSAPQAPTLAEALALVQANKYDKAERVYRTIAELEPAKAEVALLALAKLRLNKQQRVKEGLSMLDEQDIRFAAGSLRQERALSRIDALFRTRECDKAKAAVRAYATEFTHALDSLKNVDASQCLSASAPVPQK